MSDHAGDLTPTDAWACLASEPGSVLVDVRTAAEWRFVGLPDLARIGKAVVRIEWQRESGELNAGFVDELRQGLTADRRLLFLCRSGARSLAAARAAAVAGFPQAYNVADGFEGPLDEAGHRGRVAGWKAAGLDWRQG